MRDHRATGVLFAATGISGISLASSLLGLTLGLLLMLPGYALDHRRGRREALRCGRLRCWAAGASCPRFCWSPSRGVLALGFACWRGRLARTVKQTAWLCGHPSEARLAIESPQEHNRFPRSGHRRRMRARRADAPDVTKRGIYDPSPHFHCALDCNSRRRRLAYATYDYLQNIPVKTVTVATKHVVVANANLSLGRQLRKKT